MKNALVQKNHLFGNKNHKSGYILLTLLFILVAAGTLFFISNPLPAEITKQSEDFKKLEEIKKNILIRSTTGKGALTSTIIYTGVNDYPGAMPCPEDTASDALGKSKEGEEKNTCKDESLRENYLGRLAWRTLGITDIADNQGAAYWYMVNTAYTKDKRNEQTHKKINSEYDPTNNSISPKSKMYWADDGINKGDEVIAIIFAPQNAQIGQNRKGKYSSTDIPNPENYLEIVRDISNTNEIIVRRRTQKCIDNGKCSNGLLSNDLVITISYSDWISAAQARVANTVMYCIENFRQEAKIYPSTSPSHLPSIEELKGGGKLFGQFELTSLPSIFDANKIFTSNLDEIIPAEYTNWIDLLSVSNTEKNNIKKSLSIAEGYKWGNMCNNIFNRYINVMPPTLPNSFISLAISLPSITAIDLESNNNPLVCPNGCLKNRDFNKVYIPDGHWGGINDQLIPFVSAIKDRWLAQWIYHFSYALAPESCRTSLTKSDCLAVETENGCRLSDTLIIFPNAKLNSQNSRNSAPLFERASTPSDSTPINFLSNWTAFNNDITNSPELFFESHTLPDGRIINNANAKTTFEFVKAKKTSVFNDTVFFRDLGSCP